MRLIVAQLKLFDLDKLISTLTGYIETRIELLKIDIKEGLTVVITKLVLGAILVLLGFFVLLFVFLGISSVLNVALNSHYWGYLIVAAFFTIVLLIVLASREKITANIKAKLAEAEDNLVEELEEKESE